MKSPNEDTALATAEPTALQLLGEVIRRPDLNSESVAVAERLVALKERMDDKAAERAFAQAFADLQAELPQIEARGQADRYKFMRYEDIMAELRPALNRHGLTVTFSMKADDARLTAYCTVQHRSGHSRTNEYTVRLTSKTHGLNECQQDGVAGTYAKRYALCNAFNITVESDTDGRADPRSEGEPIPSDKAQYLRELCAEKGADVRRFLAFAGAPTFEEIRSARYDELVRKLNQKGNG